MQSLERRLDALKRADYQPERRPPAPPAPARPALSAVIGGRVARCAGRPYWKLVVPFGRIRPTAPELCHGTGETFAAPFECQVGHAERLLVAPPHTLVIDIETGGFSGTPVFLIGVVALDCRPLRTEQWLARDYPEEEAILRRLAHFSRARPTWVTFNGKAFDVPFLLERAVRYGIEMPVPRVHVDLLHAARRRWRGELPDHRLETLERLVLGRLRGGDVPGCDIPDLFHYFMRTQNAAPLRPVLEHNQLDLVASTELLVHLARRYDPDSPGSPRHRRQT